MMMQLLLLWVVSFAVVSEANKAPGKLEQNVTCEAELREPNDHVEEHVSNPLIVKSKTEGQKKETATCTIAGVSDSLDGESGGDESLLVKNIKPAPVSRKKFV